jgi:Tripartite tricarboxylate transporter TctB family
VLLSVLSFGWVASHLGLVPATFTVVVVAGFADRRNSVRDVMLMAGILTLACYLVFSLALQVQLAAFRWEW